MDFVLNNCSSYLRSSCFHEMETKKSAGRNRKVVSLSTICDTKGLFQLQPRIELAKNSKHVSGKFRVSSSENSVAVPRS